MLVARAGIEPEDGQAREGSFKVRLFVADFQNHHCVLVQARGQVLQQLANEVHAVRATGQGQFRLGQIFSGQLAHAVGVNVRRVAQHQVPWARHGAQAVAFQQGHALLQAVLVYVDAGHSQCVGRDVGAGDLHIGVGHGGQTGQRAVAGAQVQHLGGLVAQPVVDAAVGQQLGNKAARHDGALVDIEGHADQPGFVGQIGGGLARADTLFKKRSYLRLLLLRDSLTGYRFWRAGRKFAIHRQGQLPENQPCGFVFGSGCAMAKGHASRSQRLRAAGNQFGNGVAGDGGRGACVHGVVAALGAVVVCWRWSCSSVLR